MSNMSEMLMLDFIKIIWKLIGWNMEKTTKLMNFMTYFILILLLVIKILGILVLVFEEINTNTLADAFEIVGPYYQVLMKIIITKYSMYKVRKLLQTMQISFWPMDYFGNECKREILFIQIFVMKCFKIFCYGAYICCFVIILRPFLQTDSIYPITIYNIVDLNDKKQYLFMYCWIVLNFIFGTTVLIAIDGLFIVFICNVFCQVKMIKYAFKSLYINTINSKEEEKVYWEVKKYVNHHNLILRFIKDLTELYSIQILNQLIGNTASICMGVYIITETGTHEISTAIKAAMIIFVFLGELFIFCTAGTLITEACLDISDVMWVSGWEGVYSKRIQYATRIIIMRSQKKERLQAGNMFFVDLTSFVAILKTSISFYTFMNTIKNKEQ